MDLAQYRRINTIIERDSADATYKYALLRGVIEICQQSSHLREDDGDAVSFPLGLLVEKWLLYRISFNSVFSSLTHFHIQVLPCRQITSIYRSLSISVRSCSVTMALHFLGVLGKLQKKTPPGLMRLYV